MAVLIDLSTQQARALLDRARTAGFINLDQLVPLFLFNDYTEEDIEETRRALRTLGVELTEGMTQQERDREDLAFHAAMQRWVEEGNPLLSLTGYGWAMLERAVRLKNCRDKS